MTDRVQTLDTNYSLTIYIFRNTRDGCKNLIWYSVPCTSPVASCHDHLSELCGGAESNGCWRCCHSCSAANQGTMCYLPTADDSSYWESQCNGVRTCLSWLLHPGVLEPLQQVSRMVPNEMQRPRSNNSAVGRRGRDDSWCSAADSNQWDSWHCDLRGRSQIDSNAWKAKWPSLTDWQIEVVRSTFTYINFIYTWKSNSRQLYCKIDQLYEIKISPQTIQYSF